MREKDRKAKARATGLEAYNALGSVSKAAIRCGIVRSTLYRWLKRTKNEQNLLDYSHRPKKLVKIRNANSLCSAKFRLWPPTNYHLSSART